MNNHSVLQLTINNEDKLTDFTYKRSFCEQKINYDKQLINFLINKTLDVVLKTTYSEIVEELKIETEEDRLFINFEWDSIRSSIAKYLGVESEEFNTDRCLIDSVKTIDEITEINIIIVPPMAE